MIEGDDTILEKRYSIIVDQNLTNNRDSEENTIYRFGRLANFRDTDTLRSMSAETKSPTPCFLYRSLRPNGPRSLSCTRLPLVSAKVALGMPFFIDDITRI